MAFRLFDDPVPDMETALARTEVGARYLDQTYGDDWHTRIDADRLNIASPCRCVLGQLVGSGYYGALFTPAQIGVQGGFSCGAWDLLFFALPPSVDRSFQRLTAAWKIVLQQRTRRTGPTPQRGEPSRGTDHRNRVPRSQPDLSCPA